MIFTPDESLSRSAVELFEEFAHNTNLWWGDFCKHLTLPLDW